MHTYVRMYCFNPYACVWMHIHCMYVCTVLIHMHVYECIYIICMYVCMLCRYTIIQYWPMCMYYVVPYIVYRIQSWIFILTYTVTQHWLMVRCVHVLLCDHIYVHCVYTQLCTCNSYTYICMYARVYLCAYSITYIRTYM